MKKVLHIHIFCISPSSFTDNKMTKTSCFVFLFFSFIVFFFYDESAFAEDNVGVTADAPLRCSSTLRATFSPPP